MLIVTGANNHEWEWTAPQLKQILEETGRFSVDVTDEPQRALADREAVARYRAFVLDYNGPRWGEAAETAFLQRVRLGTGVAVIHAADHAFPGWVEYDPIHVLETVCRSAESAVRHAGIDASDIVGLGLANARIRKSFASSGLVFGSGLDGTMR